MHLYESFCRETFDEQGRLTRFQLDYPENFNFGYDVVDVMAAQAPQQQALVWCDGEGRQARFTFRDLSAGAIWRPRCSAGQGSAGETM